MIDEHMACSLETAMHLNRCNKLHKKKQKIKRKGVMKNKMRTEEENMSANNEIISYLAF